MLPRMPSRFVALVGSLAILHGTGCSWIFIQKPPPDAVEATPPVECSSSGEYPLIDTIAGWSLVAGGTLGALYGFLPTVLAGDAPWPVAWAGLAAIVAGGLLVRASYDGFDTTRDCRSLKESQLQCVSGVETACVTLKERKP